MASGAAFVVSCMFMALSRNPVSLLWWLICAFVGAAGVMWAGGWRLLPLLLLVVYAGAVVVLFLFALFMVPERASPPARGVLAAAGISLVALSCVSPPHSGGILSSEALLPLYVQCVHAFVLLLALLMVGLMAAVMVRGRSSTQQ